MFQSQYNNIDEIAVNILETLRQPLLILDADLHVIGANSAFFDTFEVTADETIATYIYDLGNGQWNIQALRELLQGVIPSQKTIEDFEVIHQFPNIGERVMLLNARRVEQNGRHDEMILLAIEDVTERRTFEHKLKHYNEALQRSNEELQQFAYVASHDLQEPLRAISGYVQLIERRYAAALDERGIHFIHEVISATKRMQTLINDLLQYSRVGTQGQPLEPVDFTKIVEEVMRDLTETIEEANAKITYDDLPILYADAPQLTRVFQNLLQNAIKYRGDETPEIHVSASYEKDKWHIAISDNGIGIEMDYSERIFAIFQRLHTRREYSGTGIGLAVAKRIVERHGGRIWVESDGVSGSTFHFTIPTHPANLDETEGQSNYEAD